MYHKWFIILITFLTTTFGVLYVINIPPRYTSSALIQVDNQLGSANNIQQMLGNIGTFASGFQVSPADIEIALIKSRFILQSVVEKLRLNLSISPYYFPLIGAKVARSRGLGNGLAKPFLHLKQYAWGGEAIELDKFDISEDFADDTFYIETGEHDHYKLFSSDNKLLLSGVLNEIAESDGQARPQISLLILKLKANPVLILKLNCATLMKY